MPLTAAANLYRTLADAVVLFHFAFVGFVLLGGLIVLRWPRVKWLHIPAVAWGIYIELSHGICPLTPLENGLRDRGGGDVYDGSFVDHYVMPILYPSGLTHDTQVAIAILIIAINGACYGLLLRRALRRPKPSPASPHPVATQARDAGAIRAPAPHDPATSDNVAVPASASANTAPPAPTAG